MRPIVRLSLLLAVLLTAFAPATSIRTTLGASEHAMVGSWQVRTHGQEAGEPVRSGIHTFGADGSLLVVIQARPNGTGPAEMLWWGEGAWEATGDTTVRYTLSWTTKYAPGNPNGTVTFDGVLIIDGDGAGFEEDSRQSTIVVRDGHGIVIATYGPGSDTTFTGQRIQIGSSIDP